MTPRATADSLRRPRTKVVDIPVVDPDTGDVGMQQFVIQRLKAGHRKRLQADTITDGLLDLEHANRLAVHLCTLEPQMSEEEWDEVDIDIVATLAGKIAEHSGHQTVTQSATPDLSEGAEAASGFPDAAPGAVVDAGVDGDRPDGSDRLDA